MRIIRTQDRIPLPEKSAEKTADDAAGRYRPENSREAGGKNDKDGGLRDER